MSDIVTVEVDRAVALITWNRPERNNAWSMPLEAAYFDALLAAEANQDVRAIVVTGEGRSFCPGMDGEALNDVAGGRLDTKPRDRTPQTLPTTIGKPIIAAINGACAGIGLVQALYCDLRFAAETAKITTSFARRGMMAEYGIAWTLQRVVGVGNAMDLLLSARVVLGDEAARLGLVNRALPAEHVVPAALDYAADLAANCSPLAMATIKGQVYRSAESSMDESRLEAIELWINKLRSYPDFAEGIGSFLERRPPTFAPLDRHDTVS